VSGPQRVPGRRDDHAEWEELSVGWALHALEPDDEVRLAAHLPGCDRCPRTVALTEDVMAAMAAGLPAAEPSPGLRDRLRAAVERTEQVRPEAVRREAARPQPVRPERPAAPRPLEPAVPRPSVDPRPGPPPEDLHLPAPTGHASSWRRVLPPALIAAAVTAILVLGAWDVVLTGQRQAAQTAAGEQAAIVEALLTPGRAVMTRMTADGREVATVVARDAQVQVVASDLEVNDPERSTYVLWGMRDEQTVALGTFDVVSSRTEARTVGSTSTGLDDYTAFGISLEPGRQAPSTPTEVVATGQVTS
jgi:hypothetical protein